jgi:DNA-binding SARP family transcriptional activator
VDVRVLGQLEIRSGDLVLPLGTPKQRTVLALLLARNGQFVSVDELVDEVWSEEPPASAGANVRMYAANLRRLFETQAAERLALIRRGSGYVLRLLDATLDAGRLTQLVRQARAAVAQGEPEPAVQRYGEAAGLWRGRPLEDVPLGWRLSAWRSSLEEQRTATVEERAEAYLSLGRFAEAVAVLRPHLAACPTREPGYATLMLALYRSGDVTGALDAFVDARKALAEQLGIEPGDRLQRLHRAVLGRDPRLRQPVPRTGAAAPTTARLVPHELPPDSPAFTGRDVELAQLRTMLTGPGQGRAVVVAIHGRGGVGKSTLAVRAARQAAAGYPDGQLYIDLHGATPGVRPRTAHEVLDRCLRGLGVPAGEVPPDASDAAARWRTLTAGRRVLLVLDNATDATQVLAALPASEGCAAIVTSRRMLATLDADGYLELDGLPDGPAAELLTRVAHRHESSEELRAIAELCEHLPLALRIAGARLAARPELSAADLAGRLRDERGRLDELGMDGYAVRGSIRVGYDGLRDSLDPVDRAAYRVFPTLGLLPVPQLHPVTVAALLGETDTGGVARALDRLVEVRLLEEAPLGRSMTPPPHPGRSMTPPPHPGRYRQHDLVRLVAGECAGEALTEAERDAAVRRALDHYLASAMRADQAMRPGRGILGGADYTPGEGIPAVPVDSAPAAVAWLDAELPSLLAAAEYAATRTDGSALFGLRLCRIIQWWLGKRADWPTELAFARTADLAATRVGDARQQAIAATLVGRAQLHLGRRDQAAVRLERALAAFRGLGDQHQVMSLLSDLGQVARLSGDYPGALEHFAEALFICRSSPVGVAEAIVLTNLADVYIDMHSWDEARGCLEESLVIRRERGDTAGETVVLPSLGYLNCQLGRLGEAIGYLDQAVRRCQAIDNQVDLWYALIVRAETHLRLGRYRSALADARQALTVCRDTAWEYETAASLRQVAKALLALRRSGPAAEYQDRAAGAFAAVTGRRDPALENLLAGVD